MYSKVAKAFANKTDFESLDNVQNSMGQDLIGLSKNWNANREFNKLTESNKLYERILGTSETGAQTSSHGWLWVARYSRQKSESIQLVVDLICSEIRGPMMAWNIGQKLMDGWTTAHQFYFNGQKNVLIKSGRGSSKPAFYR